MTTNHAFLPSSSAISRMASASRSFRHFSAVNRDVCSGKRGIHPGVLHGVASLSSSWTSRPNHEERCPVYFLSFCCVVPCPSVPQNCCLPSLGVLISLVRDQRVILPPSYSQLSWRHLHASDLLGRLTLWLALHPHAFTQSWLCQTSVPSESFRGGDECPPVGGRGSFVSESHPPLHMGYAYIRLFTLVGAGGLLSA